MTINRTFADIFDGTSQRRDAFTDIIKDCESELITDLFKEIRTAVTEQDLLSVSVNLVYRVLRCDRVVVYSLKKASQGEIIAEAVNPRFSRTLGSIIFFGRKTLASGDGISARNVFEISPIHGTVLLCLASQRAKVKEKIGMFPPTTGDDRPVGIKPVKSPVANVESETKNT